MKLCLMLFCLLFMIITSEPIEHEIIIQGKYRSLENKKIDIKVKDLLILCKNTSEIYMEIFDYDNLLEQVYPSVVKPYCKYYKAVKPGSLEILFENRSDISFIDTFLEIFEIML